MKSNEIRKRFLEYFNKKGHEIVHSGPLVPHNDPTLMFANSGMVQFKNIFTGKEKRQNLRATTSQKCVRAGGKHNDLEQVGYTTRHHTFFEMLGNFSFGDYFKDLAIEFSWELITKEFKIDKNKLLITVYKDDEESYDLWKKISGLETSKIIRISTSDNFWSMGETGPCGPCSEIFYDHGEKFQGGPPGSLNEDGDRFVEIWNLVFMQYEQISKQKRINLPKPSIDTGMGLERITALLQNTNDNYMTDIFNPLINKSIELTGSQENKTSPSHRVISDHLRSAAFLIADGVLPSNEGRGYVLRRIMRRGMRHAHSLGNKDPLFHKLFPVLLDNMKVSFPELERTKELIINTLLNEELKFKETIDHGLKILDDQIINTKNNILDGEIAFKLYDTFGFPLDLTQDYLKLKNIKVDVDQFNKKMKVQKERARKSWKGSELVSNEKNLINFIGNILPTEFLGYNNLNSEAEILKIISKDDSKNELIDNEKGYIILNQTTFYAESGGQIGDSGKIFNDNFIFHVDNTIKIFGSYFFHYGKIIKGKCKINDQVTVSINSEKRKLIKNNHSSTHLLHSALRKILGNHVLQKGSLVNDEKLRFDFSHNKKIDDKNLKKIEETVNNIINQNDNVSIKILDYKDALKEGAIALFGEKYSNEVRVITMGKDNNSFFSKELCGGTHVNKTGEINKFKIINQSSIGTGIRRIEAITGNTVFAFEKNIINQNIKDNEFKEIEISKYIKLINELSITNIPIFKSDDSSDFKLNIIKNFYENSLTKKNIENNEKNIKIETIGKYNLIYLNAIKYPKNLFNQFIDKQKKINTNSIIVLISTNDEKASIIIGITKDITDKFDARELVKISSKILNGKGGGGRKDLAQSGGENNGKFNDIYEIIKSSIKNSI